MRDLQILRQIHLRDSQGDPMTSPNRWWAMMSQVGAEYGLKADLEVMNSL